MSLQRHTVSSGTQEQVASYIHFLEKISEENWVGVRECWVYRERRPKKPPPTLRSTPGVGWWGDFRKAGCAQLCRITWTDEGSGGFAHEASFLFLGHSTRAHPCSRAGKCQLGLPPSPKLCADLPGFTPGTSARPRAPFPLLERMLLLSWQKGDSAQARCQRMRRLPADQPHRWWALSCIKKHNHHHKNLP